MSSSKVSNVLRRISKLGSSRELKRIHNFGSQKSFNIYYKHYKTTLVQGEITTWSCLSRNDNTKTENGLESWVNQWQNNIDNKF